MVACREGGLRKDERKRKKKVFFFFFFFFSSSLQQSHPGERSKRDGATRRDKGFRFFVLFPALPDHFVPISILVTLIKSPGRSFSHENVFWLGF